VSPLDRAVLRRKLEVILENLNALGPICEMSKEDYRKDVFTRKAVERMLQELIEAAIDINTHVIVAAGSAVPEDYYESFIRAGGLGLISSELAEQLAPSAGLRNRLIHEYDDIDHDIVLDAVKMAEELYPQYINQVEEYISKVRNS
jgi:uncharacterized protein YutE (UPF0331/DUF86 family)